MIKIYSGSRCDAKPIIFIDAGLHAREWLGPATVINFIYNLAMNETNQDLLELYDWYILPLGNPDGYQYTRQFNRMWRKTRNQNPGNRCIGTDANRNFGYKWNPGRFTGASTNPCSNTYAGPKPFSVPETRAIRDVLVKHQKNIKLYLSVHTYAQYFLYPYAWSSSQSARASDWRDLVRLAKVSSSAMYRRYKILSAGPDFYAAAGMSIDYVKGSLNIKYSYLIELPPAHGTFGGFVVSQKYIPSVAQDTCNGLRALAYGLKSELGKDAFCSVTKAEVTSPEPEMIIAAKTTSTNYRRTTNVVTTTVNATKEDFMPEATTVKPETTTIKRQTAPIRVIYRIYPLWILRMPEPVRTNYKKWYDCVYRRICI
ncbi:carboxypeptidase B-like isoform X2 [Gigantopelta aegis]|uniref:carboxypeptidase B-like isoform X2 n=1 Tax=Gigantopelta aegis TaxID=1735272 RepID=UPI001B8891C8|nr:carboxypeptidase B-like isoform X2 [Gigantopelta aegis]